MADVSKILDKLSPWADYKGEYVRVTPAELRALVEEVRRLDELLNGWQMIATNAEAELARLRAPAGEVGAIVKTLQADGSVYCTDAADLLTRQAAEIERLKDAAILFDLRVWVERLDNAAEASLREAVEVMRKAFNANIETNPVRLGDFHPEDCGCFRCAMDDLGDFLAKLENSDAE